MLLLRTKSATGSDLRECNFADLFVTLAGGEVN